MPARRKYRSVSLIFFYALTFSIRTGLAYMISQLCIGYPMFIQIQIKTKKIFLKCISVDRILESKRLLCIDQ